MLSVSTQIAKDDSLTQFASMLKSVAFADEIIVYNFERSDEPALKLFKQFKLVVIDVKTPAIVESIRHDQIIRAKGDWVLIMDPDEIIPPDLSGEIEAITSNLASCSAYAIPRDNYSLGYKLSHGGWGRDYVVRLVRKADFINWPKNIHSAPIVRGSTIKTTKTMEHHKDASIEQMVTKTNRYSTIEADQFLSGHLASVTSLTLIRKWIMESFRRGVIKQGLWDGAIGLIQSLYQGFSVFISYAKLYELQHTRRQHT